MSKQYRGGFDATMMGAGQAIGNQTRQRNANEEMQLVERPAGSRGARRGGAQPSKLYAFGSGDFGRLGHGDTVMQKTPKLVEILRDRDIVKFASGARHTVGLGSDGKVWSWGFGNDGQLGHGDYQLQTMPQQVKYLERENVVAIACGMCIGCPTFSVPGEIRGKLSKLQEAIRALPGLSAAKAEELAALVSPEDVVDASIANEYIAKKGGRGLGLGPNATNFVLTRAWEDVRKMCVAKGARSETLLSLSGLGDLMLTCFGGESRNAKFGSILGGAAASGTRDEDACAAYPTINFVLDNPDGA